MQHPVPSSTNVLLPATPFPNLPLRISFLPIPLKQTKNHAFVWNFPEKNSPESSEKKLNSSRREIAKRKKGGKKEREPTERKREQQRQKLYTLQTRCLEERNKAGTGRLNEFPRVSSRLSCDITRYSGRHRPGHSQIDLASELSRNLIPSLWRRAGAASGSTHAEIPRYHSSRGLHMHRPVAEIQGVRA